MRHWQIQILCHSCIIYSTNRRTAGIPSISKGIQAVLQPCQVLSQSVTDFFSSLCLYAEIKMSSQKTNTRTMPPLLKKRERKIKFKETKLILIARQVRLNHFTESKGNFVFYPAQQRSECTLTCSDFKFSYIMLCCC